MNWTNAKWDQTQVKGLREFIEERESIRLRKEAGQPFPWTQNPLLQNYHWCNCHQQDDRVSRWIAQNWRNPNADDPDLWFALLVARRATNHPETMDELGYPVPWNPDRFLQVFARRISRGNKVFHTPTYKLLLSTETNGSIAERLESALLTPMWSRRNYFKPRPDDSLASFHSRLVSARYLGDFYGGQIIADLKRAQLRNAADWMDFAVPGPGSARGLNRLLGLPMQFSDPSGCSSWSEKKRRDWHSRVFELRNVLGLLDWDLQDIQCVLCEFDKYQRLIRKDGNYHRYYRPRLNGASL